MIVSFRTSDEREVCKLLNEFQENGYRLSNYFINITHGPGGYTVFYDELLKR